MAMRRTVLIICGIVLVGFASIVASAQEMEESVPVGPPMPLIAPPLPPEGAMMPGFSGPAGPCPPPPSTGCQQAKAGLPPSVTVYGGYLDDNRGFSYTRDRADGSGVPNLIFRMPVRGGWVGASSTVWLSEALGITASAGLLIPVSNTPGEFRQEGVITGQGALRSAQLSADHQWGYVDGMGLFNVAAGECGTFSIVGGFRWDHFESRQFISLTDTTGETETGTNNVTINAYIPYVGVQSFYQSSCSKVIARLIGFPYVPGNVKFQESFNETLATGAPVNGGGEYGSPFTFTSGYFAEFWIEAARKIIGDAYLGGFFRWNLIQAKTDFNPYTTTTDVGGAFTFDEKFKYYLHALTVGGLISIDFNFF